MTKRTIMLDASSLIYLVKAGSLDLMGDLYQEVIITGAVYQEAVIEGKRRGHPDAFAIERAVADGRVYVIQYSGRCCCHVGQEWSPGHRCTSGRMRTECLRHESFGGAPPSRWSRTPFGRRAGSWGEGVPPGPPNSGGIMRPPPCPPPS